MIKFTVILHKQKLDVDVQQFEDDIKRKHPNLDTFGVYMNHSKNSLYISDLYVKDKFRGIGVGTSVMTDIIKFADLNKLPIVLIPEPDGKLSVKKLIQFYMKFGFVVNRGKHINYNLSDTFAVTMYRTPK